MVIENNMFFQTFLNTELGDIPVLFFHICLYLIKISCFLVFKLEWKVEQIFLTTELSTASRND